MTSADASLRQLHRRTMAKVGWAGLNVTLTAPQDPRGVVIVADGSGDSTFSDGDSDVARTLLDDGFAVAQVRLLARREAATDAETSELRFNTGLLADRFADVVVRCSTPAEREAVAQLTSQWFARAFAGAPPHVLHEILVESIPKRSGADNHSPRRASP